VRDPFDSQPIALPARIRQFDLSGLAMTELRSDRGSYFCVSP